MINFFKRTFLKSHSMSENSKTISDETGDDQAANPSSIDDQVGGDLAVGEADLVDKSRSAGNVEIIDADFSLDLGSSDLDRSGSENRLPENSGPIDGCDGELPDGRIVVIASRYNEAVCQSMLDAAVSTLTAAGVRDDNLLVIRVPGAWELPTAAAMVLEDDTVVGVIALGCVVKGETSHDEHINRAVSLGLMELSIDASAPIGFGLLTCNTTEQAIHRSGGNVGNKGKETADAVLEMLRLGEKLRG